MTLAHIGYWLLAFVIATEEVLSRSGPNPGHVEQHRALHRRLYLAAVPAQEGDEGA